MKKFKQLTPILLLLALAFVAVGCEGDTHITEAPECPDGSCDGDDSNGPGDGDDTSGGVFPEIERVVVVASPAEITFHESPDWYHEANPAQKMFLPGEGIYHVGGVYFVNPITDEYRTKVEVRRTNHSGVWFVNEEDDHPFITPDEDGGNKYAFDRVSISDILDDGTTLAYGEVITFTYYIDFKSDSGGYVVYAEDKVRIEWEEPSDMCTAIEETYVALLSPNPMDYYEGPVEWFHEAVPYKTMFSFGEVMNYVGGEYFCGTDDYRTTVKVYRNGVFWWANNDGTQDFIVVDVSQTYYFDQASQDLTTADGVFSGDLITFETWIDFKSDDKGFMLIPESGVTGQVKW